MGKNERNGLTLTQECARFKLGPLEVVVTFPCTITGKTNDFFQGHVDKKNCFTLRKSFPKPSMLFRRYCEGIFLLLTIWSQYFTFVSESLTNSSHTNSGSKTVMNHCFHSPDFGLLLPYCLVTLIRLSPSLT